MRKDQIISIETTRYSELFRRLFHEYAANSRAVIDGKDFEGANLLELIDTWCTNNRIKQTKNFKLLRGKAVLFGFHDNPDELWAACTELHFVEQMARDKMIRFRIMNRRRS